MKNGFVLLGMVIGLAAFAGMMRIKTDVQTLSRERAQLAAEQMRLREAKRVLEAEFAHVANPLRLQKMADGRGFVPLDMLDVVPLELDAEAAAAVTPTGVRGAAVLERVRLGD